jgi:hypothetical protein
MRVPRFTAFVAGLALLAPGVAWAQGSYKVQPIVKLGDMAGDTLLPSGGGYQFWLGPMNDAGHLLIALGTPTGSKPEMLLQAIVGTVKNATDPSGIGIFFLGRDGNMQPILLPRQELAGGIKIDAGFAGPEPSLTDAGAVTFMAPRQGQGGRFTAFRWEQGTLTPILQPDAEVPGGGKIFTLNSVIPNNKTRSVVITASLVGNSSRFGIYRLADGTITALAIPGQEMPGGGKLKSAVPSGSWGRASVSAASETGEHVFWGSSARSPGSA